MKLAVGVMGSASGVFPNATREALRALGSAIAERNCALITGACPGLSFEAVLGARARAGLVIESRLLSRCTSTLKSTVRRPTASTC